MMDATNGFPLKSGCPLPIPLPATANPRAHCRIHEHRYLRPIGDPAMIFTPCSLTRVLFQIRPCDMVVRANFHPAQAREIAFGLIGAHAFILERNRVIDPARIPSGVKQIPPAAFVGMDGCERANMIAHIGDGIAFIAHDEGKRLALALAHDDNTLALAGVVRFQAAILAIFLAVFRLHISAEITPIDFDCAIERAANLFLRHRFAQLVREDEGRLVLAVQIARQVKRGNALCAVAEYHDGGE